MTDVTHRSFWVFTLVPDVGHWIFLFFEEVKVKREKERGVDHVVLPILQCGASRNEQRGSNVP
jgi:hypothetical protein